MKIALTSGAPPLTPALERTLRADHDVAVVAERDALDPQAVAEAVRGADAVILLPPSLDPLLDPQSAGTYLDRTLRGAYYLLRAAGEASVHRIVVASTLAFFERYPASWDIAESWRPLPDPDDLRQLSAWLLEELVRQFTRTYPFTVICLRLGDVVDSVHVAGRRYDPRWLHVDDALSAFGLALHASPAPRPPGPPGEPRHGWWACHIPGGGAYTRFPLALAKDERILGYTPTHDFAGVPGATDLPPEPTEAERAGDLSLLDPRSRMPPTPARPIKNVVIFGAGGSLGAITARALAPHYRLRLTDVLPFDDVLAHARRTFHDGAPLPPVLDPPHETRTVDVSDLDQVMRACEGMDAVINCAVSRMDPTTAFPVSCVGAYHVARAAVAHGIRRVVQTGPQTFSNERPSGYSSDFAVPEDAPPRPGAWVYGLAKYLGEQSLRLFAEKHALEIVSLRYWSVKTPTTPRSVAGGVFALWVSREDLASLMQCTLATPSLPSSFEAFNVLADLPHGKYSNEKARRLLGWRPNDPLPQLWATRAGRAPHWPR